MFQVPGLILGGGIKPLKYNKITTQPDALSTVIDLLGIDAKTPIMVAQFLIKIKVISHLCNLMIITL